MTLALLPWGPGVINNFTVENGSFANLYVSDTGSPVCAFLYVVGSVNDLNNPVGP